MTDCERLGTGSPPRIVLYFYDELDPRERSTVERHLQSCPTCRRALEELSVIRSALAAMPMVEAPPNGDWTAFEQRLHEAVGVEPRPGPTVQPVVTSDTQPRRIVTDVIGIGVATGRARARAGPARYLTMAALLTLVTSGVVYVARSTARPPSSPAASPASSPAVSGAGASEPAQGPLVGSAAAASERSADAGFAALSEQHFERSKLVVLGLANRDPHLARDRDWAYERGLASNLLSDTRLYRLAAEARGMTTLAGVMGDLEIVLLQTSLAHAPETGALERIQRLIHRRDLITKMDSTSGS